MKYCPITYEIISENDNYSQRGLHLLSPKIEKLNPLPYSSAEQRQEAIDRVGKMSIQGIQAKLSAKLKIKENRFEIVDENGRYILKPQSEHYLELPENEAITMTLAATIGIEVPVHGLVYSKDGSMTYFIKRFDRVGHSQRLAMEDFGQLLGLTRDTKYDSSMEKIINVVSSFCTFPKIEYVQLLKRILFNFLIGNEDMHVKNFSLITKGNKITLSPAYDFLNSTIAQKNTKEEMALPLNGKKNNFRKKDFMEYLAVDRLGLNKNILNEIIEEIKKALPEWEKLIGCSFLSEPMKEKYLDLLSERCLRLF